MDPSDFPSPFDPLTLPEKPLAGDLPVDMEFGEDLLESQTAPSRGWAPPGPSPSSGALDLLDTPSGLEKDPGGVLDGATELLGLGGLLYKAPSPPEVDHGPEGTLAWDSGEQTLEPGPGCQTPEVMPPDPGAGASPPSPEGLLEPLAPDSPIILESPHIEEEIPPLATRRRGSPGQEEEHTQGQPQSPNAPPSPSVGETLGDGINSSQSKPGVCTPTAHPSLPGDGLTGKEIEKPPERVQKRSERVRRAEPPKPEVVDSTESIPVSDEDSDAMVDDPNDEDFVPFRPRRSPRMSLRSSMAQRAGRSSMGTKMSCAHCRTPLQKGQTAYQRKGLPQLFCSSSCLTTYSKKPLGRKTCTFCKKEIWNTKDSVVVQTGPGGSFHEFCTSVCLSLYEAQQQRPIPQSGDPADATRCSICQKTGEVLHEVSNGSVVHRLCSDSCFSKFRANKGLKTNCCDQCGAYIYARPGGLGPELLFHDGQQKRFCNTTCLGAYKKKNTRVYPCVWCKTLCKNFEMLSHVDRNGKTSLFCSLCCTTSYKVKQAGLTGPPRPCSFCRRSLSDPCYYNKVDRTVYQFCSPSCWTKFQHTSPEGGIHLSCHYCHSLFSGKPEVLEWQDQVFQFCCRDCCEDFKRLRGVVSQCEHCRQEKLLHEKLRFSGVEKSFCSEGCVLLYKQDFTKKLGLCCITCTYCSQTCQRGVTEQLDGSTWDFCSEDCKTKYLLWYCKAARCHACKRQGKLLETIHWRGQIRHFCNQQCLLRFYSQQNQPNLDTQSGPESLLNSQSSESKPQTPSQTKVENNHTVRTPDENGNLGKTPVKRATPSVPTPPPPPPPATPRKNKAAMCKPLMQNRGVSCKAEMKSKGSQTEEWKPQVIVLPIPVPIFVPVPMHLYCQKVPVPFSMPIPVPVPMFLPTTLESTEKIVETIEELKVKIPSNPLEADILAMAEMIAEAEELDKASSDLCDLVSNQSAEGLLEDCDLFGTARDDVLAMAVKMANVLDEPGQDLEADFPKNPLDINPSVDFLFDCGLVGPEDVSTEQDLPRAMRKGQKRLMLSESCSRDSLSSQPSCTGLNYSYGVNAWKCWVQSKYANGETSKAKPMRIKEDILACSAAELNYGLAQFVREITRPNGERYEPDSIYYLCLGIQQYLLENNRMVNIFTDLYYLTFVQELNKSLSTWQPTLLPNNTGPGKRKREDETILEQRENRMNPLRCPVKFYEFYLSKCPESLRTRNDVFYLQPERSCIAESPLWYSVIPMDRSMLESMLNRILAVREIYEELGRPGEEDLD
ncbi:zinc finger MYM-type protein 3 isoform 2 [Mus musculus]|uniref:Zinc finger, MYM-type 3 n=1 Tax=Mus musculus TaxID=10090 RepID=B1AXS6_MOUSE|nr:zinc finger MYM-type protein 3 isoform 2 [Mus musculus]|eukprot:NP_001171456.1 zinc finger MYM-type protein 3 isoform 2 [Mus musculus]